MATHFARGILTEGHLVSARLPSPCHIEARESPLSPHESRGLDHPPTALQSGGDATLYAVSGA